MNYCTDLFNAIETHPLDYNPSLVYQCKTDEELFIENPVLELGYIVAIRTSTGSIFGYKIGDGKTHYNALPYFDMNFGAHAPLSNEPCTFDTTTKIFDGGTSHV